MPEDELKDEQSHVTRGHGVERTKEPEPEEEASEDKSVTEEVVDPPADTGPEEKTDGKGDPIWSDTPTLANQFAKYPKLCRIEPPEHEVYDLNTPDDKRKYNAMLAGTQPPEAPTVIVYQEERQFHEGYKVFVKFSKIKYKVLLQPSDIL